MLSHSWQTDLDDLLAHSGGLPPSGYAALLPNASVAIASSPHDEGLPSTKLSPQQPTAPVATIRAAGDADGLSSAEMERLASVAYLVGCPLQRHQLNALVGVHPAMRVAAELLARGVDPERVIALMDAHAD